MLSSLPRALLEGKDTDLLSPLRFAPPGEQCAARPPAVDRSRLADALETTNAAYGHPRCAELARRLRDPDTRVVVTGQQPGVLGGPLLTLIKMMACVRWAEAIEQRGDPAVAVFWVATEDHDFEEVTRVSVLAREGPVSFDLGPDPAPLMPVGMRTLGQGITALLEELSTLQGGGQYAAWLEEVARWYRPEARVGEAFCRLMVHLMGSRAPLLLDALEPAVKEAQRVALRRLVERRQMVEDVVGAANSRLQERGHSLQVRSQGGASELFLLRRGQRRRILWHDDEHWVLRGESGGPRPVADLLAIVEENPSAVSPGVLARPVVQDAILGTSLQVLGGGELSYLAQAAPLYDLLAVRPPEVTLRPHALVLERRQVAMLEKLGLGVETLVAPADELARHLARQAGVDFVAPIQRRVADALDELVSPAVELDPSLQRPWEKSRDQVLSALERFSQKVSAAAVRRDETARQRIERLRRHCVPDGRLQERIISVGHFPGRYGEGFVAAALRQLDLGSPGLQVIVAD